MKYNLDAGSIYELDITLLKQFNITKSMDEDYPLGIIDIPDLETLQKFISVFGECVISETDITIYNDYLE